MRFIIARIVFEAAFDAESAATRGRSHSRAAASQTCTLPSKAPHLLEMHRDSSGAPVKLPAHGDRLVSINTPGRAMFRCRTNVSGLDIVHEIRAGAASDGRVLTFGSVGHEYRAGRS